MRFQKMHWHEDIQITYVLEGIIKIISLGKTIEVHQGEAVFISKRMLHQEKHKEYYLATQLVQFMYYLLLQADYEENTLQDYHHSLQKCLAFIHLHYQENLSLEEIASYGNMSVGYCGRLFIQVLQTTPTNI